jgi:hypothetical protein
MTLKVGEAVFGNHHAPDIKDMSLIPADVGIRAAIGICAIAFVSGTACCQRDAVSLNLLRLDRVCCDHRPAGA